MTLVFNRLDDTEKRRSLRRRMTPEEWMLWRHLREREHWPVRFCRQYGVGPFVVDFYAPVVRLAVEIDGGQHYSTDGAVYDRERTDFLMAYDIAVLRFSNLEVRREIDAVLETIQEALRQIPSLSRRGRGGAP